MAYWSEGLDKQCPFWEAALFSTEESILLSQKDGIDILEQMIMVTKAPRDGIW